jgi:hypothetical protein
LNDALVKQANARLGRNGNMPLGKPYVGGPDGQKEREPLSRIHHHEDGTHTIEDENGEVTGPHAHLHEAFAEIASEHGTGKSHFAHHEPYGGQYSTHESRNTSAPVTWSSSRSLEWRRFSSSHRYRSAISLLSPELILGDSPSIAKAISQLHIDLPRIRVMRAPKRLAVVQQESSVGHIKRGDGDRHVFRKGLSH